MPTLNLPAISPAEAGARARQILHENIAPLLTEADKKKYLIVDIESGDYELDANEDFAENRLRARRPSGVFVIMRGDGGRQANSAQCGVR